MIRWRTERDESGAVRREPDKRNGETRVYDSLEERCRACVVYGGKEAEERPDWWEPPCRPAANLETIKRETGRPCPRVLLDPDNGPAWGVFCSALNSDFGVLGPMLIDDLMADMDADERRVTRERVAAAIQDRRVRELRHPKPKREQRKRKAKA